MVIKGLHLRCTDTIQVLDAYLSGERSVLL